MHTTVFTFITSVVFMIGSFVWSKKSFANLLIKMFLSIMFIWSVLEFLYSSQIIKGIRIF